jgi:3-methylcrotonyl-CoA carboxylase alpha subunit
MIAKLIAHAADRDDAADLLADACRAVKCEPVKTNAWFLARLLDVEPFRAGMMTTNTIAELGGSLLEAPEPSEDLLQVAADQVVFQARFVRGQAGDPAFDRFAGLLGFRLNAEPDTRVRIDVNGQEIAVEYDFLGDRPYWDEGGGWSQAGQETVLFEDGAAYSTMPHAVRGRADGSSSNGTLSAPMPGRVVSVEVAQGDAVKAGQKLVVIEAMKMEQGLIAPFDGTVAELQAVAGAQVSEGSLLVRVEKHATHYP